MKLLRRPLGSHMSRRQASLSLVAATLAVAGLMSACSGSGSDTGLAASEGAAATTGSVAKSDAALFDELHTQTSGWNETLAPVVAHYLDPNIEASAWVAEAGPVFGELEPRIRAMGAIASKMSDADLRDQVLAIIETYQAKLTAFSKLVNAVSAGDTSAEQSAQAELDAATQEGTRLADKLMSTAGG